MAEGGVGVLAVGGRVGEGRVGSGEVGAWKVDSEPRMGCASRPSGDGSENSDILGESLSCSRNVEEINRASERVRDGRSGFELLVGRF